MEGFQTGGVYGQSKPREVYIPLRGRTLTFVGGSIHFAPTWMPSFNLTEYPVVEDPGPNDYHFPIDDGGVPNHPEFRSNLLTMLDLAWNGRPVYVGCEYGIGRTGLVLAGLGLVAKQTDLALFSRVSREDVLDVIRALRRNYHPGAVE